MTPMTPMTPGGSSSSGGGDLSKKQRHNLREQRRILRISNQFDILRQKLEAAGYQSSKKDKYSVLQATLDYIGQLERNQMPGTTAMGPHGIPPQAAMNLQRRPPHHHHGLHTPNGGGRLSISAPSPTAAGLMDPSDAGNNSKHAFLIDSMPSPVPALSMPGGLQSFPIDMDGGAGMFGNANAAPACPAIEGSTASYRDVFANSSMPSLLAKLDGTIVEANGLFLELCCKNIDELRLHSLYTMCTAVDAPKMYNLVNRILACEVASAQSKMMWHFATTGDRKVTTGLDCVAVFAEFKPSDSHSMYAGVRLRVDDPRRHAPTGKPPLQPPAAVVDCRAREHRSSAVLRRRVTSRRAVHIIASLAISLGSSSGCCAPQFCSLRPSRA